MMSGYVDPAEFDKLQEKLKAVCEHIGLDFDDSEPVSDESPIKAGKVFDGFEQEEIDLSTGAVDIAPSTISSEGWNSINDDEDVEHTIFPGIEQLEQEDVPEEEKVEEDKLVELAPVPELNDNKNKITFEQHSKIFNEESNFSLLLVDIPKVKKTIFNVTYDVDIVDELVEECQIVLHSSNGEISEQYYAKALLALRSYKFEKSKSGELGYEKQSVEDFFEIIAHELSRRVDILSKL